MSVPYTQIPAICSGIITNFIKDTQTVEVELYNTPLGALNGPVYAGSIQAPGMSDSYKVGDKVKVMTKFIFGGVENKFIDIYKDGESHILGSFKERAILEYDVQNPLTQKDKDKISFLNPHSKSGFTTSDTGEARTVSGSMFHLLKAFGNGLNENESRIHAQNYHRIIAKAHAPYYLSREYFGMFSGTSLTDKVSRVLSKNYPICFKRFVTQSLDADNWVSTCEGAWNPWVGPNNNVDIHAINQETLFSKVINHGKLRATIEMGEPGASFIKLRVDDVKSPERKTSSNKGASPANVGNRFKLEVSDKGAVSLLAAGDGTFETNKVKFKLTISENGELEILSSGKIKFSHGDNDEAVNSIVLDPAKGIDITAKNGVRINGNTLVNNKFLDWMNKNSASLCQTIALGAPAPISPIALPEFTTGISAIQDVNGFTTKNKGTNASGIINDIDHHSSV